MLALMSTGLDDAVHIGDSIFGGSPLMDDDLSMTTDTDTSASSRIGSQAFAPAPPLSAQAPLLTGPAPTYVSQAGPVPGPFSIVRPLGDPTAAAPANIGRALLLVGAGATVGYTQLGAPGILVGSLWGSAASNVWSAATSAPEERVSAATWGIIEAAAAAYLTWTALKKDSSKP